MKLLPPSQVKDLEGQELTLKILRAQETEEAAKRANINLAKAEADFASTLARNRVAWEEEEKVHLQRKQEMAKEINELEAKRLNALIPINILQDSVEENMRDAEKFMASLKEREDKVEEMKEILEDRLDEVGDREVGVAKKERELKLKEQGIERQKQLTSANAADLTGRMAAFEAKKAEEEKDIDTRKTAVFLRERSAIAQEETNRRTQKSLQNWETQLRDERQTLDRAWKEVERRKMPN